ncbi:hypothetical protein CEE69_21215 [Rhodopirellula bahusiensis]|uniref:Uncharacterized protein n=1 Tax=Rhodopirellula bahusiensis TaxID=2014065 RepID=A0A2G1W2N4_9BACT|nr:hypothetical protein CEE69_21215 [Rhodopirellula bahusiensis]
MIRLAQFPSFPPTSRRCFDAASAHFRWWPAAIDRTPEPKPRISEHKFVLGKSPFQTAFISRRTLGPVASRNPVRTLIG